MKRNLIAAAKQKLQEKKVKSSGIEDFSVLSYTKSKKYEWLTAMVNTELCTPMAIDIFTCIPFIRIIIVEALDSNIVRIAITGESKDYAKVLTYLICTLKKENSPFINRLIKLIYLYFSPTNFSSLIQQGILNKSSFMHQHSNINDTDIYFMDSLIAPMQSLYATVGDRIYDMIYVYKRNVDFIQRYSIREVFMKSLDSRMMKFIIDECKEKHKFDLTEYAAEIWNDSLIPDEEEIDEVLEETEE